MTLTPGTRIGSCEVIGPLGSGGMGDVYRARDPKLNRDVAIKTLQEAFLADPERVARFEREAQILGALNHPHIAQVYGVTEDPPALIMEFVPGESLAERLVAGPRAAEGKGALMGNVTAEGCVHLKGLAAITRPRQQQCDECVKTGDTWMHLRTCQSCSATHCCDDLPNKHARASSHPVIASAEPGERWVYCYPDDAFAEY